MKLDKFPSTNGPIDYSWVGKGPKPGPTVTFLAGLHGDEHASIEIANTLAAMICEGKVEAGQLKVALGNIDAILANKRFIKSNANRKFAMTGEPQNSEEARVLELQMFLQGTHLLLDGHNTVNPVEKPFVAVPTIDSLKNITIPGIQNVTLEEVLQVLGIPTILKGKALLEEGGSPVYADTFVMQHGGVGVTIEAGWMKDPKTQMVQEGIINLLKYLGTIEGEPTPTDVTLSVWNATKQVMGDTGFKIKKFNGLHVVEAGTTIATISDEQTCRDSGKTEVVVDEESMIIFPKKGNVKPGQMACILAQKVKE